jgi:hypothetical protein
MKALYTQNFFSAPAFDPLLDRGLSCGGSDFQPIPALQTRVHRILTLHDHTFEIQRFDFLKQCLTIADDMINKPNAANVVLWQNVLQESLALNQRATSEIITIQIDACLVRSFRPSLRNKKPKAPKS